MLILRLSRVGKKKQPTYRLVVQEKHRDPWGTSVEILGNYDPRTKALNVKEDRVKRWLDQGAQMSPTVNNLLIDKKVISGEKVRATTGDVKKEAERAEAVKDQKPSASGVPSGAREPVQEDTPAVEEKPAEEQKKEETPPAKDPPSPEATEGQGEPAEEKKEEPAAEEPPTEAEGAKKVKGQEPSATEVPPDGGEKTA